MRSLPILFVLALAACNADSQDTAVSETAADTQNNPQATAAATEAPAASPAEVTLGAPAPGFELPGSDGQTHKLTDYAGQHVVLAFFPKAFTGG